MEYSEYINVYFIIYNICIKIHNNTFMVLVITEIKQLKNLKALHQNYVVDI